MKDCNNIIIIFFLISIVVFFIIICFNKKEPFSQLLSPKNHCKINCARCPRDFYCVKNDTSELLLNPDNIDSSCYCRRM